MVVLVRAARANSMAEREAPRKTALRVAMMAMAISSSINVTPSRDATRRWGVGAGERGNGGMEEWGNEGSQE